MIWIKVQKIPIIKSKDQWNFTLHTIFYVWGVKFMSVKKTSVHKNI